MTLTPGTAVRITSGRSWAGWVASTSAVIGVRVELRVDELRLVLRGCDHDAFLDRQHPSFGGGACAVSSAVATTAASRLRADAARTDCFMRCLSRKDTCSVVGGSVQGPCQAWSPSWERGKVAWLAAVRIADPAGVGLDAAHSRALSRWAGRSRGARLSGACPPRPAIMSPMSPFADLTGQSALVTGAGSARGIGFACARLLGRWAPASRSPRRPNASTNGRTSSPPWASTASGLPPISTESREAAETSWPRSRERRDALDIVVNNAGMTSISRPATAAPLHGLSDAAFAEALQRNLATAFYVTRSALARMVPAGYGRIVNVSSVSGPIVAFRGDPGYHAAKAGLAGLTRAVALEVAETGVTVNAVAPGWIDTPSLTDGRARARQGHAVPALRHPRRGRRGGGVPGRARGVLRHRPARRGRRRPHHRGREEPAWLSRSSS